jgi:hypothetical protein
MITVETTLETIETFSDDQIAESIALLCERSDLSTDEQQTLALLRVERDFRSDPTLTLCVAALDLLDEIEKSVDAASAEIDASIVDLIEGNRS